MGNQKKLLISLLVLGALFVAMICFCIAQVMTHISVDPIKAELIKYVLENKDSPAFEPYKTGQEIYYDSTGYWDASVEYGFYYEQNDGTHTGTPYRDGLRYKYGADPSDWYYEEQICDQWWYYEIHEG